MHVLILGGSGFVGSRLAQRFRRRAGCEVEALGSRECDLTDPASSDELRGRLRANTNIIFCSTISRLREDSLSAFHRNVAMAEHVAQAAATCEHGSLVFLSSIDVYGRPPSETPITEGSPIDPAGYYGLSKYVSERILQDRCAAGVRCAILRLPGVFSLDNEDTSVLGGLFRQLRANRPVELSGDGRQRRTYLHIDDLYAVVSVILDRRWPGLLNVSSTDCHTIREAAELMRHLLGSSSRIRGVSGVGGEFDIQVDNTGLRALFPDAAPSSLEARLQERIRPEWREG